MKKLFLVLAAAFAMVACQTDINEVGVAVDGVATVEFEVGAPQMRAYSDGSTATQLQYAVYDANGNILTGLNGSKEIHGSTTVSLELAKNKRYSVIFWAAAPNAPYDVDFENKKVEVTYGGLCNDESRDAFYAYLPFEVTGAATLSVELRRPFAQLNVGASDFVAAGKSGYVPSTSALVVKNACNVLNLVTGEATGGVDATFTAFAVPSSDKNSSEYEKFPVAGYDYLAMSYVLVGKTKGAYDVEYTIKAVDNTEINNTIGAVPMQANYRTNIYGKLLTSTTDINVEIKPGYSDDNKYEVVDGKIHITVDNADEFNGAFADANVDVIILGEDINLNEATTRAVENPTYTIASGRELTIKLNEKTLSANFTPADASASIFNVTGTLNVENGTVTINREDAAFNPSYRTCVFCVSNDGAVNLDGVTAKNNGGAGMAYVLDMSNATNAAYNVENSTLESTYIAVRIFNNNKNGVHNATIKNSTLKGKYCFWVQYWLADGRTQEELDRQLNLDIYNNENTFEPAEGKLPILFGYNSFVSANGDGITKSVSEDGTEVTLGSVIENGLVRRGVAGAEENTTIKKVVVGEGITTLYDRTFRRFYALEEVILPSTLTTIGAAGSGVFQSCTNLKTVVIPESVTVLGKGTFQECSSLESINIPAGVTRIEADALRATGLVEVEFHEGVTYFGAQAFRDCKQLTKVVINAPQFTMEGNTFGIMAAPFTPMTIEVANAEMKAYVESKLTAHAKTYITVVAPATADTIEALYALTKAGENVNLNSDLTVSANYTAPYGNKMILEHNGGVLNGNGHFIRTTSGGDHYGIMTNGGTIKNITVDAFRGIVIMSANQTVVLDNVKSYGDGTCYALNTAEGNSTQDLIATNCIFNGWSSWALLKSAKFVNCSFGQGTYYTNVSGRLGKPYVSTVFEGCEFCSKFYIDLSALGADQVVTLKNCTVNGVKLTAENWASIIAPESTCGEGQISVELKDGTYLTAENVAYYFVIE